VALLGCSEKGKYEQYILQNLRVCLKIYESQMTYARAKACALEKCAYVKDKYGIVFSDEACEQYMNDFVPGLKKK